MVITIVGPNGGFETAWDCENAGILREVANGISANLGFTAAASLIIALVRLRHQGFAPGFEFLSQFAPDAGCCETPLFVGTQRAESGNRR